MKKIIALIVMLVLCVTVFAACSDNTGDASGLTKAKDYLYSLYKDKAEVTGSDYEVVGVVVIDGVKYEVEWTADITSGDAEGVKIVDDGSALVKVDVNEKAAADVVYKLKATLKDASGKTESVSFDRKVPAFKVLTWAEYIAAAAGDPLVVQGVVTGIMSKTNGNSYNCLYIQDNDGGYYVYGMAADPVTDGIEVGMTVSVTGAKDIYSGTHEVKDAVVEIIDSNKTDVTPLDYTDKFANATSLKDESITAQQAMLVTIKGVEITGQDTASGYYKFKMGDLETYVRISSSVCPMVKDDQTTFINEHAAHLGWTADVTGVICVYDGAFYLTPVSVDAIEYISLPEKSDADMVAFEKANLSFISTVSKDTTIDLRTAGVGYTQVAITWTTDNACAVVEDGKLVIDLPEKNTTVKVTATLTSGEATDTVEFVVNLVVRELTYEEVVDLAYDLADGEALDDTYRLFGVITSIDTEYSEQYGNITVTIQVGDKADKLIMCYRLKGEGAADLKVGDAITVEGVIKNYKGTIEFDAGCKLIGAGEIPDQSATVNTAYGLADGESLANAVVLKGVISKIDTEYSEQYGNITVTIVVDGMTDYPIMCYRLKGEGAADLKVGDEIVVLGKIKNYKGTIEFDAGCVLVDADSYLQVRTLLAAYALEGGASMVGTRTLTGVIKSVDTPYSEQYKNITVTIVVAGLEDYTVQCYRLKGEGAADLKVGDTITVSGTLMSYVIKEGVNLIEFGSGCTLVK